MDATHEQIARNETLFREVNERVDAVAEGFAYVEDAALLVEFVCECGDADCLEKIELTLADYEGVRRDPRRFVVLPGHENTEVARVVDRRERFLVVEKVGEAGQIAVERDPRH